MSRRQHKNDFCEALLLRLFVEPGLAGVRKKSEKTDIMIVSFRIFEVRNGENHDFANSVSTRK